MLDAINQLGSCLCQPGARFESGCGAASAGPSCCERGGEALPFFRREARTVLDLRPLEGAPARVIVRPGLRVAIASHIR